MSEKLPSSYEQAIGTFNASDKRGKVIDGVPESIPRQRMVAMLTDLGIDASVVTQDGVHIGWNRVQCEVFALDADGQRYAEQYDMATHSIAIPIVDPPREPRSKPNPAWPRFHPLWPLWRYGRRQKK